MFTQYLHYSGDNGFLEKCMSKDYCRKGRNMNKSNISIYTILVRMIGGLRAWHRRRQANRVLQALPDYLLRDIGIERHEIIGGLALHDSARPQSQPQPRSQHQTGSTKIESLPIPPIFKDAA